MTANDKKDSSSARPGSSKGKAPVQSVPAAAAAPPPPAPKPLFAGRIVLKDIPGYHRIWLCCYAGGLFKGHWSIFVESQTTPNAGTTIHAEGDPKKGFTHEFQRVSRQPWKSDRTPSYYDLGLIQTTWVTLEGPYTLGKTTKDVKPSNRLEDLALKVPAPGPSLRKATDPPSTLRLKQENCQTYIKNLVTELSNQGPEGGAPVFMISRPDILDLAPKQ